MNITKLKLSWSLLLCCDGERPQQRKSLQSIVMVTPARLRQR